MKIMVTGGSGIVGHYVIDELVTYGYEVLNVDRVKPADLSHSGTTGALRDVAADMRASWSGAVLFVELDVTDYGGVVSVLQGCDACIHLAAVPTNTGYVEEKVFVTNVTSMWNVMRAAEQLQVNKVVLGSSYNALGMLGSSLFSGGKLTPPEYFPIDDVHPTRAKEAYSVSKWVGEQVADAFSRRDSDMQLASMRFNGMWDDYQLKLLHDNPIVNESERAAAFWTYLHIRDAARACRMAIETEWKGHHTFLLNAKDTILDIPTENAIASVYPGVPLRRQLGKFEAPIENVNARRIMGWEPLESWRNSKFAS